MLTFSGPSSRRIPVDLAQGIKSSQSVSSNAARQRAAMAATAAWSEGAWNESCISGARQEVPHTPPEFICPPGAVMSYSLLSRAAVVAEQQF